MNHDLTHCSGYDLAFFAGQPHELYCELKDTCKRFKAYCELNNNNSTPVLFIEAIGCMKENYKMYWKDEE